MSCNGCRALRKKCSSSCPLRPCLEWIETPQAQCNATLFVSKFFGPKYLMNLISVVPENKGPALFQSLLFEACGRKVNPVNGAMGLFLSGNWNICQTAVETVLSKGPLQLQQLVNGMLIPNSDEAFETFVANSVKLPTSQFSTNCQPSHLNIPPIFKRENVARLGGRRWKYFLKGRQMAPTVSFISDELPRIESSNNSGVDQNLEGRELKLFV